MKRKLLWKRWISLALGAAMVGTMIPATAKAQEETSVALLADFTFDDAAHVTGGGNAKAEVKGTYELKDSKDAENGQALYLDGNASNYLTVTDADGGSLLTGKKAITISYDAKPDRTSTSWVFYAAPDTKTQTNGKEYYIGAFANGGNTKVERYNNGRTVGFTASTGTDWAHVDIVYDENVTTVYVNGLKKESVENSNAQLTDILKDNSILYIGRANWGNGESYKGWIDNFRIYDGALADEQLVDEDVAKAAVVADKEALTIPETVTEDFTLPAKGQNGSEITWTATASENAVIGTDGYTVKVKRADDADVTVTFTGTFTMGKVTDTKSFAVAVRKNMDDADVVADALKALDIADKDEVQGNITLPEKLEVEGTDKDVTVAWKSSNAEVVTDMEKDGMAAGVVTRQEKNVKVTMTATVTCGKESGTKEITLTVKAAPTQRPKTTEYLFAYFTGSEGSATDEQIYFSTSENGAQWTDLTANGSPVLSSAIGDKGVRDPYLIRSAEGDRFWLIATDLSIYYRGGWGRANATTQGSTNLVVWESDNLVDWSEPRLVDVAGNIPGAGCAWAPEAMYDANTGNYVVYWATASDESNVNGDRMNMYYATTRDFRTFSDPVLWIDREHSIIDTTMIQVGDKYYRASGDGQITIEESDSIYEGWKIIGTLKDIFNNNNYSGSKLEGPEFFKYNEDDYLTDADGNPVETWGLMCDQYSEGKGYLPFRTTNIADQTTASWSPASDVNFGSLKKRHGTILPVTRAEYNLIMQEIGKKDLPSDMTALQAETENAVSVDDKDKYTEESWTVYENALKKAEGILANDAATQRTVDEGLEELRDARIGLEEKAEPVVLESITVTAPTKTEYTVGDELELAGMKVTAKYSDGSTEDIAVTDCEISGYDKTKTGEQTVTVTYEGKTNTFKVTVKEAAATPKLPYEDVAETDWFYDEVAYNYYAETMTGTDPTHFSPYATLVRAQFATILHRIEGEPVVAYTNRFPDVPDKQFYSTAVLWAADAKVVTGYTDSGYFGTNDPITREQMVVMMYRYADYKNYDISKTADLSSFSDAEQVSGFAETAMKWAVENGIIEGKENTDNSYRLDPQGSTSRAECAIIIQRFMETFDK
ncbi:S-layer homology domain-containing protein [Dorea acetigenes]|uniref:S-layer homology domain-containing protein n=1 Tax=Dorea acetigenes TaxID=2981787 RepID=A0ABT2RLR7_9FIRM|nr:immunoglobulin-like domain-containing protein [Dorea acetigenes]MCU6686281.1 S-layer homology domain-containing protein [Dorea acetigenes]SCI86925.1 Endoglucanase precursor [uncultured Clostridium sp.]